MKRVLWVNIHLRDVATSCLRLCLWFFVFYVFGLFLSLMLGCASSMPQIENPTEACATALVLSSEIQTQAAKVSMRPIDLAREVCETALLAAKLGAANIVPDLDAGAR